MVDESVTNESIVDGSQQQQEKLFTRDQLAKIVANESAKAAQVARKELEDKYGADISQLRAQQQERNNSVSREVDVNAIYQQVQEKFNKDRQAHEEEQMRKELSNVANTYFSKVSQAKDNYSDFDAVTQDFDPSAFPQLALLIAGVDNGGDVLYDLVKNPQKLSTMNLLAERNPRLAQNELLKLSKSILDNRNAQAEAGNQSVAEPLDRLSPSRVSGSNGKKTIDDLRSESWLRG